MPYLPIFVEEIVTLLDAMTENGCENISVAGNRK